MERYFELRENTMTNNEAFERLCSILNEKYQNTVVDYSSGGIFDLDYKAVFYIPKHWGIIDFTRCAVHVSVLSKYYCIYLTQSYADGPNTLISGPKTDNERKFISDVAEYIERFYPGYRPFPMECYNDTVPGVFSSKRPFEFATFFECLITDFIF